MAADDTKTTDTKEDFGTVGKLLTGAVALVITATGTIGAASGGFASLLRNAAFPVGAALGLAALTALLAGFATVLPGGKPTRRWWLRLKVFLLSALLLFTSLGILLYAQVNLQGTSARPVVTAEWTNIGTSDVGLKISAEADSLAKTDALYIRVIGNTNTPKEVTFYWGTTGPDTSGVAKQQIAVAISVLPAGFNVNSVTVVAAVLDQETARRGASVNCQGIVQGIAPSGISLVPGKPGQVTRVAAACLTLLTVPMPQLSATPK
jgi:hypothetical protein